MGTVDAQDGGTRVRSWASIVLWSVIAAAFIGPGTVTTAASAGCEFGLALLWALVFSTLACLLLQEASARLTVLSGLTLGQALRRRYSGDWRGGFLLLLVGGAILLGCAAYEAGNILGGVAGALLVAELSPRVMTLASGLAAAGLLWFRAPRTVARLLSVVVAIMGASFLVTAWRMAPPAGELLRGSLVPLLPGGSGVLALGLIGTTVVPYNIFLGSGLASGERLGDLRLGLAVAIGLGGLISMGVLVVGTAVDAPFSFETLSTVLAQRLGGWARLLFAVGLFGAGLSSAVTAPLAAAVTARDLFGRAVDDPRWSPTSWRYRAVWLAVLVSGLGFGLSEVQPIPAIVLAQALNGLLLPLVAVFLCQAMNDRRLLGSGTNGAAANAMMLLVVLVSLLLGVSGVARAASRALGAAPPGPLPLVGWAAVVALPVVALLLRSMLRGER